MRHLRTWLSVSALLWMIIGTGCDTRPSQPAANGAPPPVTTPVGPVPGPGVQATPARNPLAADAVAMSEGRTLFVQYNCAGCHGGHAGGGMGPSLRDKDWIYGDSAAHIFSSIAEGRAHGMPAWGTKLPQEQIWQLVAYIQSLRTPQEPQPPQ